MAKDYTKGDKYRLYLNTGTYASPTWAQIAAYADPTVDPAKGDVEVPEQNQDTGHLHGVGDPVISITLLEDEGDTNVETLIAASVSGDLTHIAISRGDITTTGTKYWHLEACIFAPLSASRGDAASYDLEAKRHANSDVSLVRATAA